MVLSNDLEEVAAVGPHERLALGDDRAPVAAAEARYEAQPLVRLRHVLALHSLGGALSAGAMRKVEGTYLVRVGERHDVGGDVALLHQLAHMRQQLARVLRLAHRSQRLHSH